MPYFYDTVKKKKKTLAVRSKISIVETHLCKLCDTLLYYYSMIIAVLQQYVLVRSMPTIMQHDILQYAAAVRMLGRLLFRKVER